MTPNPSDKGSRSFAVPFSKTNLSALSRSAIKANGEDIPPMSRRQG